MNPSRRKNRRKAKRNLKKEQQKIALASQLSAERKIKAPPVPTEFRRREWGKGSDYVLSMIEEGISNASNYGATDFDAVVCEMDGERGVWLIERHNGLGMTAEQIKELACTPLTSERKGSALNGLGVTYVGSIARHPAQVVVASRSPEGEWAAFQGRADFDRGSHWLTEPRTEFLNALRNRFGDADFDKYTVYYAYPLDITVFESLLAVKYVNNLIWQCPQYIGKGEGARGYERNDDGALRIRFNEGIVRGPGPMSKRDGSSRRSVVPREEYFERFCDRSFTFPVEPFDFEIQKDAGVHVRVEKSTIHVHSFPTGKAASEQKGGGSTSWLGSIRDGLPGSKSNRDGLPLIDASKSSGEKQTRDDLDKWIASYQIEHASEDDGAHYQFNKGSGSGMGSAATYSVFLRFPCLDVEVIDDDGSLIRPFERFKWKAPACWAESSTWMNALGLNFFNPGHKFVVIELRIEEIKKIVLDKSETLPPTPEVFEPMDFAGYFGREPDFIFNKQQKCRSLALEMCDHVNQADLKEAKLYFQTLFPTPERSFFTINLGNESKDPVQRHVNFDIFNLATADKFSRTAKSGSKLQLAIYDRKKHDWVPKCDIDVPSIYKDSVTVRDLTENLEFHEIDQKSAATMQSQKGGAIKVVGLSIAKAQRKVNGKWVAFTDIKDQYSNADPNCRPRRVITLDVRGKELRICEIDDLPKRKGSKGTRKKRKPGDSIGPAPFQPVTDRDEYFVGDLEENGVYLLLNGNHPLVKKYFYIDDPIIRRHLEPIYWALNTIAQGIREGTKHFKEAPLIPEEDTVPEREYRGNLWDYALNVTLRKMLAEDRFIQDAFAKIDKVIEKNAIEQSKEEAA